MTQHNEESGIQPWVPGSGRLAWIDIFTDTIRHTINNPEDEDIQKVLEEYEIPSGPVMESIKIAMARDPNVRGIILDVEKLKEAFGNPLED